MDASTDTVVTARELVKLGPTYRQIHYWYRCGYLTPSNPYCGSGVAELRFPADQVALAISMHRLTCAGVPPATAYYALHNDGHLGHGVRITIDDSLPVDPSAGPFPEQLV